MRRATHSGGILSAVKSLGNALKPMLINPTRPSPQSSTHGSPLNERIAHPLGKRIAKPLLSSMNVGPSSESLSGAGAGLVDGIGLLCGRAISARGGTSVSSGAETARESDAADFVFEEFVARRLDPADCVRGLAPSFAVLGAGDIFEPVVAAAALRGEPSGQNIL